MSTALIPIDRKAGFPIHFTLTGQEYRVIAQCECAAELITLYDAPRADERPDERTVLIHCAQHGEQISLALIPRAETYSRAAFAWVEQRHRRERRVAWGMSHTYGASSRHREMGGSV